MDSVTSTYTTTSICPQCGKPTYYCGDPISQELADNFLCRCAKLKYLTNKLLIEHDTSWKELSKK
jgi:hypothetical protein